MLMRSLKAQGEPTSRTSSVRKVAVALVTFVVGFPVASPSQAAARAEDPAAFGADHLVVAGAAQPGWPADQVQPFEYLAYYPTELQIHRGDIVYFRNLVEDTNAFHTVTFTPEDQPRAGSWRRDEIEPILQFDNIVPSDPTCGTSAAAPPCVLESTDQFVNSGWGAGELGEPDFMNDLKLQVDLPEGAYTYYCTIHSGMEGTVEVVPGEQPVATPAEVEAQRRAEVAADTAEARALLDDPPAMRPQQIPGSENRRWFVQVGGVTPNQRVNIKLFFPPSLEIAPGDEVEFFAPETGVLPGRVESTFGLHTATFLPSPLRDGHETHWALGLGRAFPVYYWNPMCDPDEPASGLPGVPMLPAFFVGCPLESQTIEIAAHPWTVQDPLRAPDDVVTPEAFHDSGFVYPSDAPCRVACDPYTGERFASEMRAVFPAAGQYGYLCLVHSTMDGAITVSG